MKLVSAIFAASIAAASAVETTARFVNGDHLVGGISDLTTDKLVLDSPLLEQPAAFPLGGVLDLELAAETPDSEARHEATVTLTNGDTIRGQLAAVADDKIGLDTWFAGRLDFNRLMISEIAIAERPDYLFKGPASLDGWKFTGDDNAWTYRSGALRSSAMGGIARDVALPDQCRIAFDAEWRNSLTLNFRFFSDDPEGGRPGNGYELTFQNSSINLKSALESKSLGFGRAGELQENEKARIEIRASIKTGRISLFLDDHIVNAWSDPDFARQKPGRAIEFENPTPSPVKISRIEVTTWDGVETQLPDPRMGRGFGQFNLGMDNNETEEPAKPIPAKGRMELRNGDSLAGEVLGVEDGKIRVKTPFREVRLPVEALRSLSLKEVALERCKRMNGDVRGWFPDGTSLVFRLDGVGDGKLTGFSQNFGKADFEMGAFSRIEFNIYTTDLQELRASNDW